MTGLLCVLYWMLRIVDLIIRLVERMKLILAEIRRNSKKR
jgi:hypothetical protein